MKTKIFIIPIAFLMFLIVFFSSLYIARADEACAGFPDGIGCYLGGKSGICKNNSCDTSGGTGAGAGNSTGMGNGTGTAGLDCSSGVCFPSSTSLPDPSGGVATIISNVLFWILSIFGILAVIAFIISGIQYILSTGSEEMIDKAKSSMKWSIVGVTVALLGLIIIYAIDKMLRGYNNF